MAMRDGARDRRTGAPLPVSLHELLDEVGPQPRVYDPSVLPADAAHGQGDGSSYLTVTLRGARCLLPLVALRAVLAERPRVVRVPRAPAWLFGVFPYHAELLALVDPAPVLFGDAEGATVPASGAGGAAGAVVIVGSGERTLGWVVERAGEIVTAEQPASAPAEAIPGRDLTISDRYLAGDPVASASGETAARVLDVEAALDALLARLTEEGGHE